MKIKFKDGIVIEVNDYKGTSKEDIIKEAKEIHKQFKDNQKIKDETTVYRIFPDTIYSKANTFLSFMINIDNVEGNEENVNKFIDELMTSIENNVLEYETDDESYDLDNGILFIDYEFDQAYINQEELESFQNDLRSQLSGVASIVKDIAKKYKLKVYYNDYSIDESTKIDKDSYDPHTNDSKDEEDFSDFDDKLEKTLSEVWNAIRKIEYLEKDASVEKVQNVYDELEKAYNKIGKDEYFDKFCEFIQNKCPEQYKQLKLANNSKSIKDEPAFKNESEKNFFKDIMTFFNLGLFIDAEELTETYGLSLEERNAIRKLAHKYYKEVNKPYLDSKPNEVLSIKQMYNDDNCAGWIFYSGDENKCWGSNSNDLGLGEYFSLDDEEDDTDTMVLERKIELPNGLSIYVGKFTEGLTIDDIPKNEVKSMNELIKEIKSSWEIKDEKSLNQIIKEVSTFQKDKKFDVIDFKKKLEENGFEIEYIENLSKTWQEHNGEYFKDYDIKLKDKTHIFFKLIADKDFNTIEVITYKNGVRDNKIDKPNYDY